jgi:hypothetical protein
MRRDDEFGRRRIVFPSGAARAMLPTQSPFRLRVGFDHGPGRRPANLFRQQASHDVGGAGRRVRNDAFDRPACLRLRA